MSTTYEFSSLAYLKPVLHAAKHPSDTVVGLLIGDVKGKSVQVQDAIPLLHHWTDLSPMMEAGLQMAEIYVRKQGKVFVGLYVANARLEDKRIPESVLTVANALAKESPHAVVLVLDNEKLASSDPAFIPYLSSSSASTWNATSFSAPSFVLTDSTAPSKALAQVKAGKHAALGDFDDHTEDVTVDWLNNLAVSA